LQTRVQNNQTVQPFPPPSTIIDFPAYERWLQETTNLLSTQGSITWQVNGERVLVLGWSRALLMQVSHPMIAAGVSQHSVFSRSPLAKIQRFIRTQEQMLRLTYGAPNDVWQAARHIDSIHHYVHGETGEKLPYSARYFDLLKWVHATFIDSILTTYSLFVRPLSAAEKDDYVFKASIVGPLMGAPRGYFPETARELEAYIDEVLSSGVLHVGEDARHLADYILEGVPLPLIGALSRWLLTLPASVLLPPMLRDAYGLTSDARKEKQFTRLAAGIRLVWIRLPNFLRRWKIARQAERIQ
jgi:uncharacterized protein (DUF2236 family)